MRSLLDARGLRAGYGDAQVLKGIDISMTEGTITAIIGSNGAGKTTLMRALSGLIPLQAGTIELSDRDVGSEPAHRRLDLGLALVPEGRLVFPDFSVHETLRIGAFARRAHAGWKGRIEEMYDLFPRLKQRWATRAAALSGGEQQMLALARGLMSNPKLLLLDEPSLGLAPTMADEVFDKLGTIRARGVTICLVEQDVHSALALSDYGYVLENGDLKLQGISAELLNSRIIQESYLGL